MGKRMFFLLVIFILMPLVVFSAEVGPTLSAVQEQVLNIVPEDGRWYPTGDWWMTGLEEGDDLKIAVFDSTSKAVAYTLWDFTPHYNGDEWAQVGSFNKVWPDNQGSYENMPKLAVGKYTLKFMVKGKVVWETPFEIVNPTKYEGKNHFSAAGPWKDLAYFYTKDDYGAICFWYQAPTDLNWFNKESWERAFDIKADIKKDSKVILKSYFNYGNNDSFVWLYPGKTRKVCLYTSTNESGENINAVLANDGEYEVTAYVGSDNKNTWYPAAKLMVKISGGKVVMNDELTGSKADPLHKIYTASSYYGKNLIDYSVIPGYSVVQF